MGIPRLKRHLEPFAERAAIAQCDAVVDGPALAYHILNLCSRLTRRTSPFEQPSYGLLGETALAWLDRIEEGGLSMYSGVHPRTRIQADAESFQVLLYTSTAIFHVQNAPSGSTERSNPPEI